MDRAPAPPEALPERAGEAALREVGVRGMHCAGCAASATKLLLGVRGVLAAQVDAATQRARLRGAGAWAELDAALARGGYALAGRTTRLTGLGPEPAQALRALDGVRSVRAEGDALVVEHVDAPDVLDGLRDLVAARADAGLVTEADPEAAARARDVRGWRRRLLLALPAAALTMLAGMHATAHRVPSWLADPRVLWGLTGVTLLVCGAPILQGAAGALWRRRAVTRRRPGYR